MKQEYESHTHMKAHHGFHDIAKYYDDNVQRHECHQDL